MATKAQLKQYFETGKIPTQAQFGELINSFINIPSRNTEDRGNQNLFFGNGEENPYIQGVRTVSKIVSTNVITMFIFLHIIIMIMLLHSLYLFLIEQVQELQV